LQWKALRIKGLRKFEIVEAKKGVVHQTPSTAKCIMTGNRPVEEWGANYQAMCPGLARFRGSRLGRTVLRRANSL
jgi:hypothetical protein